MRGTTGLSGLANSIGRRWRWLLGIGLAATGLYVAVMASDRQGRADLPSGYAVRMTCETDPESHLWSGGCDRVAADIARTDKPSFAELYRAFVTAHHAAIPSPATRRRFAGAACEPGFDIGATLKGSRFVLSPESFAGVCGMAHARAVMDEIDTRDRALLTIEREGLSHAALVAGTLANLTEPLVLFAAISLLLALLIL
jgi:hypothetical protein